MFSYTNQQLIWQRIGVANSGAPLVSLLRLSVLSFANSWIRLVEGCSEVLGVQTTPGLCTEHRYEGARSSRRSNGILSMHLHVMNSEHLHCSRQAERKGARVREWPLLTVCNMRAHLPQRFSSKTVLQHPLLTPPLWLTQVFVLLMWDTSGRISL